jgi:biopolymer transport protein ExbD
LVKKRKSIGDSLVVFVKLADGIPYKNVTDILDEMAINDIKIYALIDLEKEEADRFGLKEYAPQPGETIISPPSQLENPSYENKEVLLIELNKNGEIAYGFGIGAKQPLTKLLASDSTHFGGIIKKLIEGKSKFEVLVKGERDAKYPTFQLVMEALKQNELFRFKMITEIE